MRKNRTQWTRWWWPRWWGSITAPSWILRMIGTLKRAIHIKRDVITSNKDEGSKDDCKKSKRIELKITKFT